MIPRDEKYHFSGLTKKSPIIQFTRTCVNSRYLDSYTPCAFKELKQADSFS